ncbi:ubiquinone anaerobic biosynthesis protein UbiV [Caulobacter sp.]|uniref:ubiquinone anaerobic biosynthesis protein UbiV n=1 Tax=Caulobacter sp. TaxID=78 RepID=UPI003BB1E873
MSPRRLELAIGPLLFNWSPERIAAFYGQIARDPAVDRVYLGEVVCGKREPLLAHALAEAADVLHTAGKIVVWSTLALPALPRDRQVIAALAADPALIEINDISALAHRPLGAPFVAGPLLNVYNEAAAGELMARGCVRLCANVEMSLPALSALSASCPGLEVEIFAFGRLPLALSGRCYHARSHDLHKDNCQFVCDRDPDGLTVETLDGVGFLAVNGVQTLSHGVQVVDNPVADLLAAGVTALRLSPHSGDMARVIAGFRAYADGILAPSALAAAIRATDPPGPLVNGYLQGGAGAQWTAQP